LSMNRRNLADDVWKACNIMRRDDGTSGILDYLEQLSWLIFLKVFEDIEKRLEDEHKFSGEVYVPIIEQKFRWSFWAKKDWKGAEIITYINNALFPYLRSLNGTPEKEKIASIFKEISGNKMKSPYNLKDVINLLDEINFNNVEDSHILSQVYEELLIKLGREGGIAGEFYTPRPIVRLMVKIIDPHINETIFDPFCGSCGFLIESYKQMIEERSLTVDEYEILQKDTFYGQEKKPLPYLIGVMNCILHGLLTPNIIRKNTLEDDIRNIPEDQRYQIILTNPPFGGEENEQIQQNFPIKSQATQLLALQYVMKKLKRNGKCAIVLPESMLSTGGAFSSVRKELIESYNIYAIVSLPAGVFANVTSSGPGPKTNLIFFDRSGPTKEIWYYELLETEGVKYSKSNPIEDEELLDCFQKFKERKISLNSWVISKKQISKDSYDLTAKNPNKKEEVTGSLPQELIQDIYLKQKRSLEILDEIEKILHESKEKIIMKTTKMSDLLTLRKDFIKISDDEKYKRLTVQLHARGLIARDEVLGSEIRIKKQQRVKTNDLVVAEIDAKVGGFGIVPSSLEGSIVSSHYYLYTINTAKVDPQYLEFYLQSGKPAREIIEGGYVKGSLNYASIRADDFLQLSILLPEDQSQQKLVVEMHLKIMELQSLLTQSQSKFELIKSSISQYILNKNPVAVNKGALSSYTNL